MWPIFNITKQNFNDELFSDETLIRYYSAFNLEGFLLGYNKNKKEFSKNKMRVNHGHVWFYPGAELYIFNELRLIKQKNNGWERGALKMASKHSITHWSNDYFHPNVAPCVFSGLIALNEIEYNGYCLSKDSEVLVDKLYLITGEKRDSGTKIKKIVDVSEKYL